jgi:hypothetical protein
MTAACERGSLCVNMRFSAESATAIHDSTPGLLNGLSRKLLWMVAIIHELAGPSGANCQV